MADLGKINTLPIIAINELGAYLDAGALGEAILPARQLTSQQVGESIDVYLYHDSADRLVATTVKPKVVADEFASLKVVQVNKMGTFLDIGLPKDLLVPFNQQHKRMEVGRHYVVKVYVDQRSQRLVGSSKLDKFLDIWPAQYKSGEKVSLVIAAKTDLGFKAIINHQHWGLLYDNEIFKPLRVGQSVDGYIKQIRDDERIDLTLTRSGKGKVIDFSDQLLNYIKSNNGFTKLNDKSAPELIQKELNVSKKTFKSTVGNLLKRGKIKLVNGGIELV